MVIGAGLVGAATAAALAATGRRVCVIDRAGPLAGATAAGEGNILVSDKLPRPELAAALLAGGVSSWRVTRSGGRRRGLFCGIGPCFDRLVDVNEDRCVRACLIPVHDGDRVRTSVSLGPAE